MGAIVLLGNRNILALPRIFNVAQRVTERLSPLLIEEGCRATRDGVVSYGASDY